MLWTIRRRMREWARGRSMLNPVATNRLSVKNRASLIFVINVLCFSIAWHFVGSHFSQKIFYKTDPKTGDSRPLTEAEISRYSFSAKILPKNVSDVILKKQLEMAKAELVDIEEEELS